MVSKNPTIPISVLSVSFFLVMGWTNIGLSQNLNGSSQWDLVNKTFSEAINSQNKFNITNSVSRGTALIEKVPVIALQGKKFRTKGRSKAPVLLPRLRKTKNIAINDYKKKPSNLLKNSKKQVSPDKKTGIWRLEYGNEDRGIFVDLWEPIYDPIFGGSPTDGGMSWGLHLSYTPYKNPFWVKSIRPYLPWINNVAPARTSYSIEQSANMHSHLTRKNRKYSEHLWNSEQRPDAGYLAGNARIGIQEVQTPKRRRVDMIDLSAGIVGPYSGAQSVHQVVHDLTGGGTDKWHQINSEPFVNANYEYGYRFFLWEPNEKETIELHPHIGAALGTAMTHAKLGFTIRIGRLLEYDMGAPRLAQMLTGSNFPNIKNKKISWNIFTGIEGRAHAHNILLDENLITGGQSVNSHPYTYDVQTGFEFGYGNYRLTAMNVYRSREYKGQQYTNEFVRVALAAEF